MGTGVSVTVGPATLRLALDALRSRAGPVRSRAGPGASIGGQPRVFPVTAPLADCCPRFRDCRAVAADVLLGRAGPGAVGVDGGVRPRCVCPGRTASRRAGGSRPDGTGGARRGCVRWLDRREPRIHSRIRNSGLADWSAAGVATQSGVGRGSWAGGRGRPRDRAGAAADEPRTTRRARSPARHHRSEG